ncbi:flagellar basal body L-ring protein FlgH [Sphingopyxis sp.]|uniref:flagellar basal body L-ring protein FlgH n=1 Tax=Sphingopyxis sp. TaxID=1908224 RepID=UPI002FC9DA9F
MRLPLLAAALLIGPATHAEQLYRGGQWAGVATDNRAQSVGDVVMILISESASATNRVRNNSSKSTSLSGGISVGSIDESADFGLRGGYSGSGEVERTDRFVARMAAQVVEVLPNGDFIVEGKQNLTINGERRNIAVRGQVRQVDISSDNSIPSARLANAEIDYDGKGWVSRSAQPGLINRIFSFLGIG